MNQRKTPAAKHTSLTLTMHEQRPWRTFVLALGLAFALPGVSEAAEPAPPASVGVYAKHVGGKIAYYYRVTNRSPLDITAVSIGYDTRNDNDPGNDTWELSELPSGWNPKLGVPSATSNSPTGWRVSMTIPGDMPPSAEDIKAHAITWEIINKKSPVLYSGQTFAKMSITLDKADDSYMNAHALVTFAGGPAGTPAKDVPAPATKAPPFNISVPLERLDARPPALAIALSPATIWPADNKLVPVSATFPVKEDEFDNLPEIRLESVTANEPLEPDDVHDASYGLDDRYLRLRAKRNGSADRIYTVTYSATDASGNRAIAAATVTVPANAPAVITPAPAMPAQAPVTAPPATKAPLAPGATAPHDPGKKESLKPGN